jgi:NitT/TauT family transport system substrate-binding protein
MNTLTTGVLKDSIVGNFWPIRPLWRCLIAWLSQTVAAEPSPEIRKIRLVKIPAICLAPQYLAEELLRLEGFSEVEYVEMNAYPARVVYSGRRILLRTRRRPSSLRLTRASPW